MSNIQIFTIGHSNHSLEGFLGLLWRHQVTAVADVRSAPYSRFCPHFNREPLAAALKMHSIRYTYFGRELGGRPDDPTCYEGGRVQYERVAETHGFRDGVARVVDGARRHRTVLMCTEKEPLDCHRTLLVARALYDTGVAVTHILADGALESQGRTIDRLMTELDLNPHGTLFQPREELVAQAIAVRARRVGFVNKGSAAKSRRQIR